MSKYTLRNLQSLAAHAHNRASAADSAKFYCEYGTEGRRYNEELFITWNNAANAYEKAARKVLKSIKSAT